MAAVPEHVLVVIDEAYFEYQDPAHAVDASAWLSKYPNLVVSRTFSKAYGLAGLRVGYLLSSPAVADLVNRVRQPFNVNSLALSAAQAAISDTEFIQQSRDMNRQGLQRLQEALPAMGFRIYPSAGNFLLVDMGSDSGVWYEALLRDGIITRRVGNYGLPNHLRITIGTDEQMSRLLASLERLCGELQSTAS